VDEYVDESDPGMQQKMTDAINTAIGAGEFVTKFLCLVEVIDSDGEAALWAVTSSEINSWDILGMLSWGIQHEQSGKLLRMLGQAMEEDEDE
jgi:hypothetical protein